MAGSTESLPRALTGCAIPAGHALRPQTDRDPLISPASRSNVRRIGVGGSVHQQQWGVPLDAAVVRANNRRIDVALLPLLSLLYLFNGLDRGNIGNAQTQGFAHDIGCVPDDVNVAVSLFYAAFVLLQPLSAVVGVWLGPRHWISCLMLLWGGVTLSQAFIWGRGALLTTRLLMGVLEAGFYPTAVLYLARFYHRFDLGTRLALFYGQYSIANAFSGAMAYGIFHIRHPTLKPWQLLFIIQGLLTCVLALVAWVWLPDGPKTAWFLTEEQRSRVVERTRTKTECSGPWRRRWIRDGIEVARDWKLWFVLACNICASVPSTAFSVFLPLVVQGMGFSSLEANLMSVPPAICGTIGLYLFACSSDRQQERGYHIVAALSIALLGLVAVVTASTNEARYAALCVFLFGSYVSAPLTTAWLSGNTPAAGKRAWVLGVNGLGNLAGVIGAQLYRAEEGPEYRRPLVTTLVFVVAAMAGYVAYRLTLQAVNGKRATVGAKSADRIEAEDGGRGGCSDRHADSPVEGTHTYDL